MPVSLKQAEDILVHAPEQDCVVLVSPPGTGKSSASFRAAKRMGAMYLPIYAATMEAIDARGLPYLLDAAIKEQKQVGWAAPSFLPLDMEKDKWEGKTVLVNFDDWFQAPPPVLRATVRSIYGDGTERKIGDFPVYANTRFIATGNREQDRAGVYRPETYVNDRITYVEVEPDADEWASGAMGGFGHPAFDKNYPDVRAAINKEVAKGVPEVLIAFVKKFKKCYDFSTEQRSFLSPRSIERLGRFIRAFDAAKLNGDMLREVANGTIGEAEAMKFLAFFRLRDKMPDVNAVLRGEEVPLPPETEVLYILTTTVLRAAKEEHIPAVAKLGKRMAEMRDSEGMLSGVEISAFLFQECISGSATAMKPMRGHPLFHQWMKKNQNFLMPEEK